MKKYFVLVTLVILSASCSKKIHSSQATGENAASGAIRVMSYNVRHCSPPSTGLIDVAGTAAVIKSQNPDLVALQEIDVNTKRSGQVNEAEELAKILDMHFYFGKTIDYDGGAYGIAILSKYPITQQKFYRLPTDSSTKGEPRGFITVKVALPNGKNIRFGSTHLDAQRLPVNRDLQIQEIIRIAASDKLPFLFAGDLNSVAGSNVITQLDQHFTRTCQSCGFTIPASKPNKTIDFISFSKSSDFKVISHEVVPENHASDHLGILAVLQ